MNNSVEQQLVSLDPRIMGLARRYQRPGIDADDLAQIGRIAAWESAQKYTEPAYLVQAAKSAIRNYVASQFAKKRAPKGGLASLDSALAEDGDATLHDVVADHQNVHPSTLIAEPSSDRDIISALKEKFGGWYLEEIGKMRNPKQIVKAIFRKAIDESQIPKDQIATEVDYNFFVQRGLDWPLWIFYNNSPSDAKLDLFPELKMWEFKHVPSGYWQGKRGYKRAIEAVQSFCEDHKITSAEECQDVRVRDFGDYGLNGMLQEVFAGSPYLALKAIFPEFDRSNKKYVKGKFPDAASVKSRLNEYFIKNGVGNVEGQTLEELWDTPLRNLRLTKDLRSIFGTVIRDDFSGSAYRLITHHFPNIKPWSISGPHIGWQKEPLKTSAEATRWLFENYLQISQAEIPQFATDNNFRHVGFSGMIGKKPFQNNIFKFVDNAYPGIFTQSQFDRHRKVVRLDELTEAEDQPE